MKILVVEDDARISTVIRQTLTEAGYAVDTQATAPAAMEAFDRGCYDLVLLDLMIPGSPEGGMDVCRHIRASTEDLPVLMLTALGTKRNLVEGLDAGADDYLVKPFHLVELLARVRALLRRAPRAQPSVLHAQGVSLDPATRTATRAGRVIDLSAKEFAVLVPIVDIVGLTGLNLAALAEADVLAPLHAIREASPRKLWVELTEISGVRLLSGTGRLPT